MDVRGGKGRRRGGIDGTEDVKTGLATELEETRGRVWGFAVEVRGAEVQADCGGLCRLAFVCLPTFTPACPHISPFPHSSSASAGWSGRGGGGSGGNGSGEFNGKNPHRRRS